METLRREKTEALTRQSEAVKVCRVCAVEKSVVDFYARKGSRDGRNHECKTCLRRRTSENQKRNAAGRKAKWSRYYSAHREQLLAKQREKYARTKEYYRAWQQKEYESRPHVVLARNARRKAAKLRATPPWADLTGIKKTYEVASFLGLDVDHIVPLRSKRVCGLHVPANLRILDPKVNRSKGNRHWPDMPAG